MSNHLASCLDFAVETAYLAGRLTLGYFQAGIRPDFKADQTPVTVADQKAEKLIRGRIEKKFPDHAIVGEEFGESAHKGANHRWYIDPIDGTKAFTRGVPLYGVLLGLEIEGRVEAGVAYFPALDEMVAAATGLGCRFNGRLARVSSVERMADAVATFTDPGSFAQYGRAEAWQRIEQATYVRAGWGDAYGHCLVATGRAEVMLDAVVNVWDCAPFPPILKEAGGYFGDWSGNETICANEAISANAAVLPRVLELIRG
ncbi:MAG: inositol monophosphatase family protein [Desulfosalsimonas sp.]|uniref:inositol monophosphatase family protein n=1 Tax=Desulfosalsimonas sp. TaxID=3073848 RepID=UPI0039707BF7